MKLIIFFNFVFFYLVQAQNVDEMLKNLKGGQGDFIKNFKNIVNETYKEEMLKTFKQAINDLKKNEKITENSENIEILDKLENQVEELSKELTAEKIKNVLNSLIDLVGKNDIPNKDELLNDLQMIKLLLGQGNINNNLPNIDFDKIPIFPSTPKGIDTSTLKDNKCPPGYCKINNECVEDLFCANNSNNSDIYIICGSIILFVLFIIFLYCKCRNKINRTDIEFINHVRIPETTIIHKKERINTSEEAANMTSGLNPADNKASLMRYEDL